MSKVSFTMYQFRGADWIEFTFSITGILIGNNFLSEKHNCRIEWNNPNDEVRHSSLDLESSAAAIDIVTKAIEKAVATSVNSEVMGLMSYESAILNEHYGDVVEVAAKALNPPYFLDKIWMAAVRFADEHTDIMDLVIGSRRSRNTTGRIKGIAGRTNCLIMVKRKVLPHFFVTGNTACAVNACVQQIRKRIEWAAIIQKKKLDSVAGKKGFTSSQNDEWYAYGPASKRTFRDSLSTSEEFAFAGVNELQGKSRRKSSPARQESLAKRLKTGCSRQRTAGKMQKRVLLIPTCAYYQYLIKGKPTQNRIFFVR